MVDYSTIIVLVKNYRIKESSVKELRTFSSGAVVVVRSKAINHLHLAMVLMSTVGLSSLFSFILRTHMVL